MTVIELILTTIGVSLNVFAITVCEGATYADLEKKKVFRICIIFGVVQTIFLLIGSIIAAIPVFDYENTKIICFFIFIFLGYLMYCRAFNKKQLAEVRNNNFNYKKIFLLAVKTSIDALIIGFGISLLDTKILLAIVIMFINTIIITVLGLQSGYHLGFEHRKGAYIIGGSILIILGVKIIIKYL